MPIILNPGAYFDILQSVRGCRQGTVHHASISVPGHVTAHAVGETFILLWARLLGVGYERLVLSVSSATGRHVEFVLDENEQTDFVQRPVEVPTVEWLPAFRAECLRVRKNLHRNGRNGMVAPPPGDDGAAGRGR